MRRIPSGPSRGGGGVPPLPPSFTELCQILEETVKVGSLINVIGMVKGCQLPIKTKGPDDKMNMTLFDLSTEDDKEAGVNFDIFRPEKTMPTVRNWDVVVLSQAKVQMYRNEISLLCNVVTDINVYTANKIPRLPRTAEVALVRDKAAKGRKSLADEIHHYVSYFYHQIDKSALPDAEEFQQRANASLNVKDKFRLLSDVREGNYYNLVARVVRTPYHNPDKSTLYVSDYTKNEDFFNITWEGLSNIPGAVGDSDPYGYTEAKSSPSKTEWLGPYGKRAMQVTLWGPHADFVRNEVSVGQWVSLRNVHIKRGRDGQYLEGAMHEDMRASTKVNVDVLDATDAENMDPRLKECLRRWRDYERSKKQEEKELLAAETAGAKRRGEDGPHNDQPKAKKNRKERRIEKITAVDKKEEEKRQKEEAQLALNGFINCENQDSRPPQSIESMLQQMTISVGPDDEAPIPFACNKARARVRVVDFYPPNLEDFAQSRVKTPFEVLSDVSDDENDSGSGSENEQDAMDRGYERVWEWRFALELQDAVPGNSQETLWAVVDNSEGQCLTNLDACDLKKDQETLTKLRECLFTLWGNLEEEKLKRLKKPSPPLETPSRGLRGRSKLAQFERPPLDSSDNEDNQGNQAKQGNKVPQQAISNKPFDCCIREYAIRNKGEIAEDGDEAKKWTRVFGLYGTKIRT